jgi:hypothetical protein
MVANYTRNYEKQIQFSLEIVHVDEKVYMNELVAHWL